MVFVMYSLCPYGTQITTSLDNESQDTRGHGKLAFLTGAVFYPSAVFPKVDFYTVSIDGGGKGSFPATTSS